MSKLGPDSTAPPHPLFPFPIPSSHPRLPPRLPHPAHTHIHTHSKPKPILPQYPNQIYTHKNICSMCAKKKITPSNDNQSHLHMLSHHAGLSPTKASHLPSKLTKRGNDGNPSRTLISTAIRSLPPPLQPTPPNPLKSQPKPCALTPSPQHPRQNLGPQIPRRAVHPARGQIPNRIHGPPTDAPTTQVQHWPT